MRLSFRANIVVRVFILVGLLLGMLLCFSTEGLYLTGIAAFILVVISTVNLIRYLEASNRNMAYFLEGIHFDDYVSTGTGKHKGKTFEELHGAFSVINDKFLEIRAEKEANHQLLHSLVGKVEIGIICFDQEGEIILLNQAFKKLLQKPHLVNFKSLQKIDPVLYEGIKALLPGEKKLIKTVIKGKPLNLSAQSLQLNLLDRTFRMVLLQDIRSELEEQEFASWHKLIRILTHEIMNSVAPISTMSGAMNETLTQKDELGDKDIQRLRKSMEVIQRRSENLMSFTETYRNLTRIPPPQLEKVQLPELLQGIQELFRSELEEKQIQFQLSTPNEQIFIQADPTLLEQVIINLVKNAIEAVEEVASPAISIQIRRPLEGETHLMVIDNGQGISPENLDKVFVPFYSTKENGSGIGLSLSRQIIMMHKAHLEIQSRVGEGTAVSIIF